MAESAAADRHADRIRASAVLAAYLDRASDEDWVVAVHHDETENQWAWYVRLAGEERDYVAIWFEVRERTMAFESYLMPPPQENHEDLYLYLLKVNHGLVGVKYGIGGTDELGVFLTGHLPVDRVDEAALDATVGLVWETIERHFATAMAIGYASVYRRRSPAAGPGHSGER